VPGEPLYTGVVALIAILAAPVAMLANETNTAKHDISASPNMIVILADDK